MAQRLTKTPAAVHSWNRRWAEEWEQMPVASNAPHWQPVRRTKKMASMALRSGTLGLWQPRVWSGRGGRSGSIRSQRTSGIRHGSSWTGGVDLGPVRVWAMGVPLWGHFQPQEVLRPAY